MSCRFQNVRISSNYNGLWNISAPIDNSHWKLSIGAEIVKNMQAWAKNDFTTIFRKKTNLKKWWFEKKIIFEQYSKMMIRKKKHFSSFENQKMFFLPNFHFFKTPQNPYLTRKIRIKTKWVYEFFSSFEKLVKHSSAIFSTIQNAIWTRFKEVRDFWKMSDFPFLTFFVPIFTFLTRFSPTVG